MPHTLNSNQARLFFLRIHLGLPNQVLWLELMVNLISAPPLP